MTLLKLLEGLERGPVRLKDFVRVSGLFETGIDPKSGSLTIRLSYKGHERLKTLRAQAGTKAGKPKVKRTDAQLVAEVNRAAEYREAAARHQAAWAARRQGRAPRPAKAQEPARGLFKMPSWSR